MKSYGRWTIKWGEEGAVMRDALAVPLERTPEATLSSPSPESSLLINEMAEAILETLDTSHLFAVTVEKTKQLLGAEGASLLLVDENTGELYFDAVCGGADMLRRFRLRPGEGVAGWGVEHEQPALVPDVQHDARFSASADTASDFRTRSIVAVPLFIDRRVCAVLEAVNPLDGNPFTYHSLEALLWLAPHVAIAIKNSRITAELLRSREEIQRHNEVLEERISERTAQLARAKLQWERTFDSITDPLFLMEGHTIQRANLACAVLAGEDVRAIIGRHCYQALARRHSPCEACQAAAGGGKCEVVLRSRTFRVTTFPTDLGAVVVHYRDVTEERHLETQLRDSQRMASVGQLAAGAAHEINNPLGFLLANLSTLKAHIEDLSRTVSRISAIQALAREGSTQRAIALLTHEELVPNDALLALGEAPEIINEAQQGGRRVHEIVRALRELSHEGTMLRLQERVDDLLARAIKRARVPLSRLIVESSPLTVAAEPQLEVAFANILHNAMQASTEDAPIRIEITSPQGGAVIIAIADCGCGMPPEVRARVFDPFFTTRGIGQGLGLGLTMAYGIVARHNGQIAIESEVGLGTTVTVLLPQTP